MIPVRTHHTILGEAKDAVRENMMTELYYSVGGDDYDAWRGDYEEWVDAWDALLTVILLALAKNPEL